MIARLRAAWAARRARRLEQDELLAAADREIDARARARATDGQLERLMADVLATNEPSAGVVGCTCGSCVEAAAATADFLRERQQSDRALRDAAAAVRFRAMLRDDDLAWLDGLGVSL